MRINLIRRRSTALLSAAVLAASGILATTGTAGAVITRGAGTAAGSGVPNFYKDAQGLALQLCTDANANLCDPPVDDHIGVYFAAEATTPHLRAIYGVEAVQNADNPGGAPLVSNGTRFRLSGLRPGTRYTITDPWGTTTVRTDGTGGRDFRMETGGRFDAVQNGHVTTFLRSLKRNGADFIGSANLTSRVAGSPTGFNKVRLTGPGGRSWTTDQFSLMGQKRDNTAMSAVSKRSLALGNGRQADVVTRTIKYSSFGTATARPTVRKGGVNPGAFSVRDNCAAQAPGSACAITVKFAPRQNAGVKKAFLVIDDNGLAAPRRVNLKGVGSR
jgi:hypothetical protein